MLLLTFVFSCSNKSAETAMAEENIQVTSEIENPAEVKEEAADQYSVDKAIKADFD